MSDSAAKAPKERSKSFPVIPLRSAIERLQQFEAKFTRHPAPYEKAGLAWGMEEGSSQANRILAALKSFGLIDYNGSGKDRSVSISDAGRTYLRAHQDSVKMEVLKAAALKPKQIARFWPLWGADRPPKEVCLDQLVLKDGFTSTSAPQFLRVYDETIAFAGLSSSDKIGFVDRSVDDDDSDEGDEMEAVQPPSAGPVVRSAPLPLASSLIPTSQMGDNERVLTTGLLSKDASFKLVVTGRVGVKELERLIKKLEIDKEILAEPNDDSTAD